MLLTVNNLCALQDMLTQAETQLARVRAHLATMSKDLDLALEDGRADDTVFSTDDERDDLL